MKLKALFTLLFMTITTQALADIHVIDTMVMSTHPISERLSKKYDFNEFGINYGRSKLTTIVQIAFLAEGDISYLGAKDRKHLDFLASFACEAEAKKQAPLLIINGRQIEFRSYAHTSFGQSPALKGYNISKGYREHYIYALFKCIGVYSHKI